MTQADRDRFWELATAEESTTDEQLGLQLFTAENLRFHLSVTAAAALHRFDLELHVGNIDPVDLFLMLGARFNYWTDDVPTRSDIPPMTPPKSGNVNTRHRSTQIVGIPRSS
jgi:hypothetical protein